MLAGLERGDGRIGSQRDFAREWAESIRVKRRKPLGEEAL